jgi:hypothetical protein
MKIAILPRMSSPKRVEMLLGCLLFYFALCLLTALPAAAQADSVTPFSADLDGYAKLGFYVPTSVPVEPESLEPLNYTEGREINAVLLINGSRVSLHLLYPCQAPTARLEPNALKTAINTFNSGLSQTVYNPTPLNISGQSALWGQVGNQIVVAYQPSIKTIALVMIDESLDENTLEYLLESLEITVNEGSSPLFPGYCPDTGGSGAVPAQAVSKSTVPALDSSMFKEKGFDVGTGVGTGTTPSAPAPSGDNNAGINAAQKMLDALKKG